MNRWTSLAIAGTGAGLSAPIALTVHSVNASAFSEVSYVSNDSTRKPDVFFTPNLIVPSKPPKPVVSKPETLTQTSSGASEAQQGQQENSDQGSEQQQQQVHQESREESSNSSIVRKKCPKVVFKSWLSNFNPSGCS